MIALIILKGLLVLDYNNGKDKTKYNVQASESFRF